MGQMVYSMITSSSWVMLVFTIYKTKFAKIQPAALNQTLSFADEVLLYRTGYNIQIGTDIKETLEKIYVWCKETDFILNPENASVLWCSLYNATEKADLPSQHLLYY